MKQICYIGEIRDMDTNLCVVREGEITEDNNLIEGKSGYMDKEGNMKCGFVYDWAGPFENGIAPVRVERKYFFINKKIERISDFTDDAAIVLGEPRVRKNARNGTLDLQAIPIKGLYPIKWD